MKHIVVSKGALSFLGLSASLLYLGRMYAAWGRPTRSSVALVLRVVKIVVKIEFEPYCGL